jgi:pimeloyl-ACP methyl ester carboxylesterase
MPTSIKWLAVGRDHDVRRGQDPEPADLERRLVIGEGIHLRGPVGVPPRMRAGHHPFIGRDEQGGILVGVARRQDQASVGADGAAVALMIEPLIPVIARPEVDDFGLREEADVDGVVRMVVGEDNVGHPLRSNAELPKGPEDELAVGDHPGVDHDHRVTVEDEADASSHAVVPDVAGVQEVMARCHGLSILAATRAGAGPRYPDEVISGHPDPPLPRCTWGANRYVEVGGERTHLIERGKHGPRVLLLHGYASNAQAWRAVMDRLDGRFQMAAVDTVGFGWSTRYPTAPLTGDAYAERLVGVLDALGWASAHVAGQSWGGGLAQRLAAAHPERVNRLVLVATVDPSRSLWLGTAGLRLGIRVPWLAMLAVARAQRVAARAAGVGRLDMARGYVDPLRLAGTGPFLDRFVAEHATSSHLDLGRIAAPTLVIGPLEDRVVLPEITRSVAARIPGARYAAIPGTGHSVTAEQPSIVADLMASFLEDERPVAAR